jgi:hypothetical protein
MLLVIILVVYSTQKISEQNSQPPIDTRATKEDYEIAKLSAEIRQIRSDTSGSLFWLKMIALFVTVGGAVGGYLVGQKHTTKKRLEFENLKNIDSVYQGIVLELAAESPLLRAAAAVRLGMILKSFPSEWVVENARKNQMIQLTKQVLAASLAIEDDPDLKVLKTLTIALVLHKRWEPDLTEAIGGASKLLLVHVPFAFRAGDKALPSGDYAVAITASRDELVIQGLNSSTVEVRLELSSEASESSERAKLVFHRYDKNHFLSEVRTAGKRGILQLLKTEREQKLERQLAGNSPKEAPPRNTCEVVKIMDMTGYADVRELDLSGAKAADAYWARVDFTYSDFYKAKLASASLRGSVLRGVAFREAELTDAVLAEADCSEANFKLADLRRADLRQTDLTNATLTKANFEDAKVFECVLTGAKFKENPDTLVDISKDGDGSQKIKLTEWIALHQGTNKTS